MTTGAIIIFGLVLGLALLDIALGQVQPRIVNGYSSSIEDMKHIVNLRKNGNFMCGGSVVSETMILTAAHCVEGVKASQLTVYGGQTTLTGRGVVRRVSTIIYSSKYNNETVTWDVALLRLASPMRGTNISPIELCDSQLPSGTSVQISGWGRTSEDGKTSNQLLSIDATTMSRSTCQRYFWDHEITTTMMCVSTGGSKDACSGDSGGPLISNDKQYGIVSWGVGCARPYYPAVFTDVCSPEIKAYINYVIAKYG